MKTIELKGIIKIERDTWDKIKLISDDGYKIDLVGRFQEMQDSFKKHLCQINYWVTDSPKTKDQMLEGWLQTLFGGIDAEYGAETYYGSSQTGSWTEEWTRLKVGG